MGRWLPDPDHVPEAEPLTAAEPDWRGSKGPGGGAWLMGDYSSGTRGTFRGSLVGRSFPRRRSAKPAESSRWRGYSTFCTCSLIRSMAPLTSTIAREISELGDLLAIVLASRSISWERKSSVRP